VFVRQEAITPGQHKLEGLRQRLSAGAVVKGVDENGVVKVEFEDGNVLAINPRNLSLETRKLFRLGEEGLGLCLLVTQRVAYAPVELAGWRYNHKDGDRPPNLAVLCDFGNPLAEAKAEDLKALKAVEGEAASAG
jgi:hypothetical protein